MFYESGDPTERNCKEHSKSVARFLRLTAALVSFIKETTTNKLSISDYTLSVVRCLNKFCFRILKVALISFILNKLLPSLSR